MKYIIKENCDNYWYVIPIHLEADFDEWDECIDKVAAGRAEKGYNEWNDYEISHPTEIVIEEYEKR